MKINSIKPAVTKFIDNVKYEKEQKFLNKYVQVHDEGMSADAYKEIMKARKTIANYVAPKAVAVDIYSNGSESKKGLDIVVQDLLHSKKTSRTMNADTKAIHNHVVDDYIVVDHAWDGVQQTRLTTHEYEETFLKTLYRNISEMVNNLQGKK